MISSNQLCQDWNTVVFNNVSKESREKQLHKERSKNSNRQFNNLTTRLEPPKDLGKIISQARTSKNLTQKQLAIQLQVAQQTYALWENGRETPTNLQISNIEKILGIKLPRSKKVKIEQLE